MNSILMEGWLVKQAVSAPIPLKNWKRRYIILRPGCIEWRDGPNQRRKGSLTIKPATRVSFGGAEREHCISVALYGTTLVLQCASDQEMRQWFNALLTAVNHISQPGLPNPTVPLPVGAPLAVPPAAVPIGLPVEAIGIPPATSGPVYGTHVPPTQGPTQSI